ncbi:MAG: hypothetical protein DRI94_08885 [Bacteroidetes bacterium]|nr:MAG: hypothetical protein DRI94_08885 [Bacteroidota bacterium]
MRIELTHDLEKEKGTACAEKIFKQLSDEYKDEFSDLEQETNGNIINFSFKIRGMHVKGNITVNNKNVVIDSKLPFAARMFQGMIETKIKENAEKMISECK